MKQLSLRKIIVLLLDFCLVIFPLNVSFAMEKPSKNSNLPNNDDIALLRDNYLIGEGYGEIIDVKNIKKDNSLIKEYTIDYDGTINQISILNHNDKKITFQIKQPSDNILNILEIYSDGKMILDGQPIEITRTTYYEGQPEPLSGGASIYFQSYDYGSSSDYTHYLKKENISNIACHQMISRIATGALMTIVSMAMGGIFASISGAISGILTELANYNPTSTALSSKSTVYTHKNYTDGYIPSLFSHIYKYKTTFYSKINYGGKAKSVTMYKHIMHDM